jgi:hypothetical protein
MLGIITAAWCAPAPQTEAQLHQRIQAQQNPVKKAKDEIKLSRLKLAEVEDAYSKGKTEQGAKLLGALVGEMKGSWKLLQNSGRIASKQPDGFRELEIALREHARALQDLERRVSYFDRAPLTNAAQEFEQMRSEVLQELFPDDKTRNHKGASAPQTVPNPGSSSAPVQ